ncbi:MAG: hypothetical protein E6Q97_10510 [Desulfurellales bacterium]|nr:MAG: hypothetical protein E6Q97_10510 [Desulfurellales bacterium]
MSLDGLRSRFPLNAGSKTFKTIKEVLDHVEEAIGFTQRFDTDETHIVRAGVALGQMGLCSGEAPLERGYLVSLAFIYLYGEENQE